MVKTGSGAAFAIIAAASVSIASPAQASPSDWDKASNYARDGLVVVALGLPLVQKDWKGEWQAGATIAGTVAVTEGLKEAIPEDRPDHSDRKSFPSGHTSTSFAAASTLHRRYGWQVGIPAHVVAAFVAVARVEAKKHHVHDVIVGGAIGEAAGWLITQPKNDKVRWLPWGDAHGAGVAVSYRF